MHAKDVYIVKMEPQLFTSDGHLEANEKNSPNAAK